MQPNDKIQDIAERCANWALLNGYGYVNHSDLLKYAHHCVSEFTSLQLTLNIANLSTHNLATEHERIVKEWEKKYADLQSAFAQTNEAYVGVCKEKNEWKDAYDGMRYSWNDTADKLSTAQIQVEQMKKLLLQFIEPSGHNTNCGYDPDGNDPDSDFCTCGKSIFKALSAIYQTKGEKV